MFNLFSLLEIGAARCPSGWGNPSAEGMFYQFMKITAINTNSRGSWMEESRFCQITGAKMKWPGGATLATIGSSSDQEAVMTAMNGVDPKKYPQVYIGGFNINYSGKKFDLET